MSLYRKYRPQTFADLVGQNHVSQTLANALKLDRVNHAYLFTGPRGTGKTTSARLLAKALNCSARHEGCDPCNSCELCTDIRDGRLIDVLEIDAASNRGIDEMRDLREKIQFAPTRGKVKVYIIDEVHMLTKEAFNALLKTLEEPPEHVFFILATTEVHKIPETILSRCQRFDFQRLDHQVIIDQLASIAEKEKITVEPEALELIAQQAEGGMRDAIGLLEQLTVNGKLTQDHVQEVLGIGGSESLGKLFDCLKQADLATAMAEIDALYQGGHDLNYFHKRFLELLRQEMVSSVKANDEAFTARIVRFIDFFQEAYGNIRLTTIPQLPLEVAAARSCLELNASTPANAPVPEQSEAARQPRPTPTPLEREHKNISTSPSSSPAEKKSLHNQSLTIETVTSKWPQILEQVSPIAKRSLQQATPLRVDGITVTLGFVQAFHAEKIMEKTQRAQVEAALRTVLDHALKISTEIHAEKADQSTTVGPGSSSTSTSPTSIGMSSSSSSKPDGPLAASVLEVFGA